MNALSWLLYLADVAGTAKVVFSVGLIAAAFALLFASLFYGIESEGPSVPLRAAARWWPAIALSFAVVIITPSRETIYAIAASEMGEAALSSQTGGRAVEALNAWLDRQIAGQPLAKDRPQ